MNSALLFGRRPDADHRFVNAYEMAGFYARHMLRLIELTGEAPIQLGFLSGEPGAVSASLQHLSQLPSYAQIWAHLLANEAEASGVCMVTLNTRDRKRASGLLVQVHDFVDGISADITVPYAWNGSSPLLASEPEIAQLIGAEPEAQGLAELGVEFAFRTHF